MLVLVLVLVLAQAKPAELRPDIKMSRLSFAEGAGAQLGKGSFGVVVRA